MLLWLWKSITNLELKVGSYDHIEEARIVCLVGATKNKVVREENQIVISRPDI